MRKILICLSLVVLGFTTARANATPHEPSQNSAVTLITFEEFKALDSVRQERYVQGLQFLFDDWAELQKQDGSIEYQNAALDPSRPSVFASLVSILDAANAASAPQACVYAGYVSNVDSSGRFCQSVERGNKAGWVTCNPLVYGPNVYAPQGGGASTYCSSHAKTPEEIRRYVLAHKTEFTELRTSVSENACTNTKNPSVCNAVRFRVGQMYDQVKDQLPATARDPRTGARASVVVAPAPAARSVQRQSLPSGRPYASGRVGGADGSDGPGAAASARAVRGGAPPPLPPAEILGAPAAARPVAAAPAPAPAPSAGAAPVTDEMEGGRTPTSACPAFDRNRRCDPNALMQPLTGPEDTSWAGKTLMGLEPAKSLYCSLDPINPQFLQSVRTFLHTQQARVRSTASVYSNCTKKRNPEACVRTTNNYYQCYFKQMEDNFEACVQEAQANRSASRIPNNGSVSAVITPRGAGFDFRTSGGTAAETISTFTVESYLGLMFGMFHVDLCKVQVAGASGTSPAAVSAPAAAASSAVAPAAH